MATRLGWLFLALFALQNSSNAVLGQFVLQWHKPISARVAVLMQELVVKLPLSIILYGVECGGIASLVRNLRSNPELRSPNAWLRVSLPAALYTMGGTLQFVAGMSLDAGLTSVLMQSNKLFVAGLSVVLLGTKLSCTKWVSLVVLSLGIAIVVMPEATVVHASATRSSKASALSAPGVSTTAPHARTPVTHFRTEATNSTLHHKLLPHYKTGTGVPHAHRAEATNSTLHHKLPHYKTGPAAAHASTLVTHATTEATNSTLHKLPHYKTVRTLAANVSRGAHATVIAHHRSHSQLRRLADPRGAGPHKSYPFSVGVAAMLGSASCSALASVYFEMMVKRGAMQREPPSLWIFNMQLSVVSSGVAAAGILARSEPGGLLSNFDVYAWATVTWGAPLHCRTAPSCRVGTVASCVSLTCERLLHTVLRRRWHWRPFRRDGSQVR
jgi:drug/metabolite transporter (DMT)-like permease